MQDVIDFNLLKEYDTTLKDVLEVWTKQKAYSLGDKVKYKGHLLECITAGASGTTTLNFTGLDIGDTITDGTVVWEMIEPPSSSGNGLNDWIANTQYKIDSIVVNNGQIYKSLVEFTSGSTFDNIEILEDYTLQTGDTPILWSEGTEINTNDIVEYNSNYYKALYDFTCGSTFTKNVFEEYVPKSLTDEEVEEVINSYTPEFNGGSGGENYSTEEKRIGTWVDGKPLYQKTLVGVCQSNMFDIDVSSLNIDKCIGIGGLIDVANFSLTGNLGSYFLATNNYGAFYYDNTGNLSQISINFGSIIQITGESYYITVKYTKTTD